MNGKLPRGAMLALALLLGTDVASPLDDCIGQVCHAGYFESVLPGTGWSVLSLGIYVDGKAKVVDPPCIACRKCQTAIIWAFDGWPWDKYRILTSSGATTGSGDAAGVHRLEAECDALDTWIGQYEDDDEWATGAGVTLECGCP